MHGAAIAWHPVASTKAGCPPHAKLLPAQCETLQAGPVSIVLQVYKALRGGVQDVAVKVLLATDEEQLLQFEKVRPGAFSSRTRSLVVKPP